MATDMHNVSLQTSLPNTVIDLILKSRIKSERIIRLHWIPFTLHAHERMRL